MLVLPCAGGCASKPRAPTPSNDARPLPSIPSLSLLLGLRRYEERVAEELIAQPQNSIWISVQDGHLLVQRQHPLRPLIHATNLVFALFSKQTHPRKEEPCGISASGRAATSKWKYCTAGLASRV